MPPEVNKRVIIYAGAAILVMLIGAGLWAARRHDVHAVFGQGMEVLRSAGPGFFFAAMVLLPAAGAPVSLFSITAGSLFGDWLGMPLVALLCALAIIANVSLSYLLARGILRSLLQRLISRLGYPLPAIGSADIDVIVLLRVTPGVPFFVQNYLLGVAAVPFKRYLLVSCLVALPINAAFLLFGAGVFEGDSKSTLTGLLILVAAVAAIRLVRKLYRTPPQPTGN